MNGTDVSRETSVHLAGTAGTAGAQCNHLRHVATQLPYASVVAAVCLVGYIIAGFTGNPWIAL
ncbi:Na+/H+ antiporter NhaC family protein, partial [Eggerthella lenta]|uniref:Na+/H+ antiporter NhaC family protein n=1 Tax=Eggerthella lenta TaxID=84112 RepID=UPI002162F6E1